MWVIEATGDVQVVIVQGNMDGGWETLAMKDQVADLVKAGERKFIVDLEAAHFINSTGIGVLVAILATVRGAGGGFKLCRVGSRVRRSLVATGGGIWESLDVRGSREDAIRSLQAAG